MLQVGQGQGVLMHARGINAADALLKIITRANNDGTRLPLAAQDIVNNFTDNALDHVVAS